MVNPPRFVVEFDALDIDARHIVGYHAASLGNLKKFNLHLPAGFIIPPAAYFSFLEYKDLIKKINHLLGSVNFEHPDSVRQVATHIRNLINSSSLPTQFVSEIFSEYEKLGQKDVKLHTSIVSGDQSQNDFPREYFLEHIRGESALVDLVRSSWASVFEPGLITYRNINGIDHLKSGLSCVVSQVIVPTFAGKIHTRDKDFKDQSRLIVDVDGGRFVIDKITGQISKRATGSEPKVYINGGKLVREEGLDPRIAEYALTLVNTLESASFDGHEVEWVYDNNKFYVLNTKPQNFYG